MGRLPINEQLMDNEILRSKFRGCILGTLVGDSIGIPFEFCLQDKQAVQRLLDDLEQTYYKGPTMKYSDDSAMTKFVLESLLQRPKIDYKSIAKSLVRGYYSETGRHYGNHVRYVFNRLRKEKFKDIHRPAKLQFEGKGSFGNGGATRVAPIALLCHEDYDRMVDCVVKVTTITHSHPLGVNGAILQAFAICSALKLDPRESFDRRQFVQELIVKIRRFEENGENCSETYVDKLQSIITCLENEENFNVEAVVSCLGNGIAAINSVPTAIFCFLRAQNNIAGIKCKNKFRRSIQYAVSLGGDTDTIAAMTGAIAGAYYGDKEINRSLLYRCEKHKCFQNLADDLFDTLMDLNSPPRSKYRGALLGSLLGNCFGLPFKGDTYTSGLKMVVQRNIDTLEDPKFEGLCKAYSDDTVMTKCIAQTLVDKPPVDYKHMAKLFVDEYFREPRRGYGMNVVDVFKKLRANNFDDVYKPAKEQFRGTGSYGNGGAMRVAPIALYFHRDYKAMLDAAEKATRLTHSNPLGINGALLQCMAVYQSLHLHPQENLDVLQFTEDLIDKMKDIEKEPYTEDDPTPYQTQLKLLIEFLKVKNDNPLTEEEVTVGLGNGVAALYSVPTAIYCFLKAHQEMPEIQCDNKLRKAIQYAITLGGDTDTIAAMTGAIAGAYYGEGIINKTLLSHCEKHEDMTDLADKLYEGSVNLEKVQASCS